MLQKYCCKPNLKKIASAKKTMRLDTIIAIIRSYNGTFVIPFTFNELYEIYVLSGSVQFLHV